MRHLAPTVECQHWDRYACSLDWVGPLPPTIFCSQVSELQEWWHLGQIPVTKENVSEISSFPWDKFLALSSPLILYHKVNYLTLTYTAILKVCCINITSIGENWLAFFFFFLNGRSCWKISSLIPSLIPKWDFRLRLVLHRSCLWIQG